MDPTTGEHQEPSRSPTGILSLPTELRLEIYAHLFASLRPATLPIYKTPDCPNWLLRSHSGIFCPAILQTCKTCFLEAYPIFIREVGTPLLRIDHPRTWSVSCVPNQPAPRYWWTENLPPGRHVKPEMRPLSTSLPPILLSVPSSRMEIVVPQGNEEFSETERTRIVALLKWMRAVLVARATTGTSLRLGCLLVVLTLPHNPSSACMLTLGVLQQAAGSFAVVCSELRVEQRWRSGGREESTVVCEVKEGRYGFYGRGEGWKDVEKAWKELFGSCRERSYFWRNAWLDFL